MAYKYTRTYKNRTNGDGYPDKYKNGGYNNPQGERPVKHSGAKIVRWSKDGGFLSSDKLVHGVSAWNYSKSAGLVSVFAAPYHKTKEHASKKSGVIYLTYISKIFYKRTGQTILEPVLVDASTMKFVIEKLGWVVNPAAPNGGYCGTFTK